MDDTTRPGTNEHDRDEWRAGTSRRTRVRRTTIHLGATGSSLMGTVLAVMGHEELSLAAHSVAASLRVLNTVLDHRARR
ncbi:hypothetical protein GV791_09165 [Nocardia cyriacigeorgica]|uniref:Uncharacterized protein n=1 Tax=Nocardia cyriacigeorgica TaxID=135487 RepID=A0A6P1CJL7_9NOCA|nr:hypothetical protein [Nocardia cyriacigeorgica]NEW32730.1 hypothetical protein [Nocardia cyriacigeorgica]PPJ03617.1 hypothetical protein C5E43_24830 [Nocardia cyriacigeorgica]